MNTQDHDLISDRDPIADLVKDLRELGTQVGADRAAQARAWSQKITAEGALLQALLDALPDAWSALLGPNGAPFTLLHVVATNATLELRRGLRGLDDKPSVLLWARYTGDPPQDVVSAEWACITFGLQRILTAMIDALDVHAGKGMLKSAEKMHRHAEFVRALTVVLRKGAT